MSQIVLGASTFYQHEQATASATWVIPHNLYRYPVVDVYTTIGGNLVKIMPNAVTYDSPTGCTLSFSTPFSGFATVA